MTVLLTTHDMEEADKLSDRVAVMDRGKILVIDTPESLKSSGVGSSVIEAGLKNASPEISRQLVGSLAAKGLAAVVKDGTLSVTRQDSASRTGDDVASLMRSVLDTAAEKDVDLSSLAIRNRTLEDVFISLTGRGLRE
jgi:ABC-2 type transport system ATP-binding protein